MSLFYGDIGDNIAFGIQAIDRPEVANFSASGDEVYLRIFTNNNNIAYTNFANAGLIGTSNYDPTATNRNNLFLGTITDSNVLNKTVLIQENRVGINRLTPTTALDVAGTVRASEGFLASNIGGLGLGGTGDISFRFARVLDVDALVVRSNITVTLGGNGSYTNLPTNLVTLDPSTGRILDQYISSNIVRLMNGTGLINPNLIPPIAGFQSSSVTNNFLGVGLDNPQQPLHVNGNACVTGGRLSIGTITPLAVLHVADDNGPNPTVLIQQQGSSDPLTVIGSNAAPLLTIRGYNSVGIATAAPSSAYALDVAGTGLRAAGLRTTQTLTSDTGTVSLANNNLAGILTLTTSNLVIQNALSAPGTLSTSNLVSTVQVQAPVVAADTLTTATQAFITANTAVRITGFATGLYTTPQQTFGNTSNPTRIGLSVANNVLAQAYLSTSDARVKSAITPLDPAAALATLTALRPCEYDLALPPHEAAAASGAPADPTVLAPAGRRMAGLLAQEVEPLIPSAVRRTRNAIPSILRYATPAPEYAPPTPEQDPVFRLPGHGLAEGDLLCVLGPEKGAPAQAARVEQVLSEDLFALDTAFPGAPGAKGAPVFVYGHVVEDFRLLDYERLMPYTLGAVRGLHDRLVALEDSVREVRARLGLPA